jgi:flagellar FliJ protein
MPRAFRFKLAPVLRYRKQVEDDRTRELAAVRAAVAGQRRLMRQLYEEESRCKAEITRLEKGRVDVQDVLAHRRFVNTLQRRQRIAYQDLQRLLTNESDALQALIKAIKARKVMERLRDRRYAAYQHEVAVEERNFLDEVGAGRARYAASH